MSAVHPLDFVPTETSRIGWLADAVRRNRFMPAPPEERVFVGDGDFRAVGAEFLRHCVEIGGLTPESHVLDIGCGIGRLAVPLTQYLEAPRGLYDGIDPVASGIAWCEENITPAYPTFRFHHLPVRHPIYNPGGHLDGAAVILPFEPDTFDFALMISVATHLPAAEVRRYAYEAARVLAPGGRLMLTAFVIEEGFDPEAPGHDSRLRFTRRADGPEWQAHPGQSLAAVAFSDGVIETLAATAGLVVRSKALGSWRGRPAPHFQDIFVIEKGKSDR